MDAQGVSQAGKSPEYKPAAQGWFRHSIGGYHGAATRHQPGPIPSGGRPPAEGRPLG